MDDDAGKASAGVERFLAAARSHGEMTDSKQWVSDLEDMLRVAWDLMTAEQQEGFRTHAEVEAMLEMAGEEPG